MEDENSLIDQDDLVEAIEKLNKTTRESIMKLFVLACKTNKEQRAYEYALTMDTFTLNLAINMQQKLDT